MIKIKIDLNQIIYLYYKQLQRFIRKLAMILKLDQNNSIEIDMNHGGRIISLILQGHQVISTQQPQSLKYGSFLMFPWVNRLRKYQHQAPIHDNKGYPLHGLCVSTPRNYSITKTNQNIKIQLVNSSFQQNIPQFRECFLLQKGRLSIDFECFDQKLPYCFGYHPYLQIDKYLLSQLKLTTDINTQIQLDEDLLPIYPFLKKQILIDNTSKYDNLFVGGSYLQLESPQKVALRISSNLNYWQIYTPDNYRIAVEPMSFCGNLYQIYKSAGNINLTNKGEIKIEILNQNYN